MLALSRPDPVCARVSLPDIGLGRGSLHEFYAATHADATCLSGSALMLGQAIGSGQKLWIRPIPHDRETGAPYALGLAELGLDPARFLLMQAPDTQSTLQAGLEGARCSALAAVILELWGEAKAYDLTASRRLALAAKESGVPVFLTRVAAHPVPSAAATRWQTRAIPSQPLAANAPGQPAFALTLLRARDGREGLNYVLEWNRDARQFLIRTAPPLADRSAGNLPRPGGDASLPRAVVPVPFDRPGAARLGPQRLRHTG